MQSLIRALWYICVLRDGPQQLPASKFLLQWMIVLHLLLGTLYSLPFSSLASSLHHELALLLVSLGFVAILLLLNRHSERFNQTAAALLGADVVISGIGLLLYVVLLLGLDLTSLWESANVLLMIWSYLVAAHVFRHALDSSFALGLLLSFLLLLSSVLFLLVVQELILV